MENRRKYIYWALMGPTLTAAALALSSGGMYFIENLSIQFFGDEPTPAVNLWVIAFSTIAVAAFMIFSVWLNKKQEADKPTEGAKQIDQLDSNKLPPGFCGNAAEAISSVVLNHTGEVPLDEMEDGERILYKCFRYEGGEKHVFYRVLVKFTDEEDGPLLRDDRDSDMDWDQEGTKCFGAWGFIDVRDVTNHDDGSKYKEVPY